MAENKNITIEQYNGVDYDVLYPKTIIEQVVGGISNDDVATTATKQLFNLSANDAPNNVLYFLGQYNLYWWQRRNSANVPYAQLEDVTARTKLLDTENSEGSSNLYYSKNLTFNQSERTISLSSPTLLKATTSSEVTTVANTLIANAPCYVWRGYADSPIYYIPEGATYTTDESSSNPATIYRDYWDEEEGSYALYLNRIGVPRAQMATYAQSADVGEWQYLTSKNENQYLHAGVQDGYEYEFLGKPYDNFVAPIKISTGSYIGTDTSGKDNPNSLVFDFKPKLVIIQHLVSSVAGGGGAFGIFFAYRYTETYEYGAYTSLSGSSIQPSTKEYAKLDGNTMSWYYKDTGDSGKQYNSSSGAYEWLAIG